MSGSDRLEDRIEERHCGGPKWKCCAFLQASPNFPYAPECGPYSDLTVDRVQIDDDALASPTPAR